jgi:putative hydrolase of the HAD superfamily
MNPAFPAVFFDLFDTLCVIDPDRYIEGQHRVADLLGLPFGPFFREWVAAGGPCQTGEIATERDRFRFVLDRLGHGVTDSLLARAVAHNQENLLAATSLYEDARDTLEALAGLPAPRIGLISNASSSALLLFQNLRLFRYFREPVFSFQVGLMKPDPRIYRLACRRLGVVPAAALFVGDGGARELDGAAGAGLTTVKIRRSGLLEMFRRGESRGWDHELGDLRQVLDILAL